MCTVIFYFTKLKTFFFSEKSLKILNFRNGINNPFTEDNREK